MTRPTLQMISFVALAVCCFGAALALLTRNQADDAFGMAVIGLACIAAASGR